MTLDCTCNRLKEAEAALKMACEKISDMCGTCPAAWFGWDLEECADECTDNYAECWRKALIRKARREA